MQAHNIKGWRHDLLKIERPKSYTKPPTNNLLHTKVINRKGEGMDWKGFLRNISSIPLFESLVRRNTHSFNEMEVKYRFYPYYKKRQIKGEGYGSKIKYFFPFNSFFYKIQNISEKIHNTFHSILLWSTHSIQFHSFINPQTYCNQQIHNILKETSLFSSWIWETFNKPLFLFYFSFLHFSFLHYFSPFYLAH